MMVLRLRHLEKSIRRCKWIHLLLEHPYLSSNTLAEDKAQPGGLCQGSVQAETMKERVVLRKQRPSHTEEQEVQQVKAEVTAGLRRTAHEVHTPFTQAQFSVRHQLW